MHLNSNLRKLGFLLFVFHLALSSCKTLPKAYIRPGSNLNQINRLAVMPFENLTNDRFAAKKVQNLMVMELLHTGQFDVIEPGEVVKAVRTDSVSINSLSIDEIKSIGQQLGVPAIMAGSVNAYGVTRGVTISYPEVTISCLILDTATGNIIASSEYTSGGTSFWSRHLKAEGATLDETAQNATKILVRSLFQK